MLAKDIKIGSIYRCKVGARIATVQVQSVETRGGRRVHLCRTLDTDRTVRASAAKLRPYSIEDKQAEAARAAQRAARPAKPVREFAGHPGTSFVDLPGRAPVQALSQANAAMVADIVDRCHVFDSPAHAFRKVHASISRRFRWASIPRALRRGITYAAISRHLANRRMYTEIMGHEPLPTHRHIAEAISRRLDIPCPRP